MTTPADIRRLLAKLANSTQKAEARLPWAITAVALNTATGHPTTASGNANTGGRGKAELDPTESAAHTNLGDLIGWDTGERTNTTGDDTHQTGYHPGPGERLSDVASELRAALTCLDQAHRYLTDCGVPPFVTHQLRCRGINGQGCEEWADPNRDDHLGIDCGRAVDSNRRRKRRHTRARSEIGFEEGTDIPA